MIRAFLDALASLDRKHLVGKPEILKATGIPVVLPENLLKAIRESQDGK